MFDVISFGTATFDVFLRSEGMEVENNDGVQDLCFRLGAKLEVREIYFDYGGGGTNSAVTFARQGLSVASVVQVGDDFTGKKILTDLNNEGVGTDLINIQSGNTDYSTILWAPDGGRTILVYRGKTKLETENVVWDKLSAKWFYISSLEGNIEIVSRLADFGTKIMWNPGSRELKQKEKIIELLPKITILNVNKEEMEELTGVHDSHGELLKAAAKLPCEWIVITDDRRGAYLWEKKNQNWWRTGIFEDSPRVETTGAGDGFGSGLAVGMIKGLEIQDSLFLASANASSVVAEVGAKKGILKEADLQSWDRHKLTIEKIVV
jgi:sugar/nucleoside kinase (ribokinase family)